MISKAPGGKDDKGKDEQRELTPRTIYFLAPYGASILFQRKYDGSLRMGINHRALNKVTIKNKSPILLIVD